MKNTKDSQYFTIHYEDKDLSLVNDTEKALALCKSAESVLDERNLVCKTNKNNNI